MDKNIFDMSYKKSKQNPLIFFIITQTLHMHLNVLYHITDTNQRTDNMIKILLIRKKIVRMASNKILP